MPRPLPPFNAVPVDYVDLTPGPGVRPPTRFSEFIAFLTSPKNPGRDVLEGVMEDAQEILELAIESADRVCELVEPLTKDAEVSAEQPDQREGAKERASSRAREISGHKDRIGRLRQQIDVTRSRVQSIAPGSVVLEELSQIADRVDTEMWRFFHCETEATLKVEYIESLEIPVVRESLPGDVEISADDPVQIRVPDVEAEESESTPGEPGLLEQIRSDVEGEFQSLGAALGELVEDEIRQRGEGEPPPSSGEVLLNPAESELSEGEAEVAREEEQAAERRGRRDRRG